MEGPGNMQKRTKGVRKDNTKNKKITQKEMKGAKAGKTENKKVHAEGNERSKGRQNREQKSSHGRK